MAGPPFCVHDRLMVLHVFAFSLARSQRCEERWIPEVFPLREASSAFACAASAPRNRTLCAARPVPVGLMSNDRRLRSKQKSQVRLFVAGNKSTAGPVTLMGAYGPLFCSTPRLGGSGKRLLSVHAC